MTYFNTTNQTGKDLEKSEAKVMTQDEIIFGFFRAHAAGYYTPAEVQRMCLPGAPLTSVRRGITNLTNDGDLIKTTYKKPGTPRVSTGVKDRVNKLKSLGNAIVPQTVVPIMQAIEDIKQIKELKQ